VNQLRIILLVSAVLISPFFINDAFAFTEVNNTTGFVASSASERGNIANTNSNLTCPAFSPPASYTYITSNEIRIPDSSLAGICERSFAEVDVSAISTFTNVVTSIELRLDIVDEGQDTRTCDFTSMEFQPSIISQIPTTLVTDLERERVHDDILDGTIFVSGVGNPFCANPAIQNDQVLDLGSLAVTDMNDAFGVSQSWWAVGIKFQNETRVLIPAGDFPACNGGAGGFNGCNIRIVHADPEIRINYTTITDNVLPVITVTGDNPISVLLNTFYGDEGATATDDFSVDSADIVVDSSAVDTSTLGNYLVTFNVDDRVGNSAVEVTRTVNVIEGTVNIISGDGSGSASPSKTGSGGQGSVSKLSDVQPIAPAPAPTAPTSVDRALSFFDQLNSFFDFDRAEEQVTAPVAPTAPAPAPTPEPDQRESFVDAIRDFFSSLFG